MQKNVAVEGNREKAVRLYEEFENNKALTKLYRVNTWANAIGGLALMVYGVSTDDSAVIAMGSTLFIKSAIDDTLARSSRRKGNNASDELENLRIETDTTLPHEILILQKDVSKYRAESKFIGVGHFLLRQIARNKGDERHALMALNNNKEQYVKPSMAL